MPAKRISEKGYRQLYSDIQPYVNFKIPKRKKLNRKQRAEIKAYHHEVRELMARPHQVYKSKSRKNLKAVQSFAQHPPGFGKIRVAFVPTNGVDRQKISVKNGRVYVTTKHVITRSLKFNLQKLVVDPEREVARVIARDNSDLYALQAGAHEIPQTATRDAVADVVMRRMREYSPGGDRFKDGKNGGNHFNNWLFGLNGYKFKNQDEDNTQYMQSKQRAKKNYQRKTKAKRKKMRADGRRG